MRQVIESNAESGDGVSIEREQPSTASKSMASFIKLGDIKGEFAGAYSNSLGGFRECSALFTTGGGGDSLTDAGLVFPGLYDSAGYEGSGDLTCMSNAIDCDRNEHGIITETFEPAAGVDFAGSLNPAPGLGGTAGPGATSFMTGSENFDVVAHGVMPGKLNFDVVAH